MACPEHRASALTHNWGPAGVLSGMGRGRCRLHAGLHAWFPQADAIFFCFRSGSIFLPALPLLCPRVPESPGRRAFIHVGYPGFTSGPPGFCGGCQGTRPDRLNWGCGEVVVIGGFTDGWHRTVTSARYIQWATFSLGVGRGGCFFPLHGVEHNLFSFLTLKR